MSHEQPELQKKPLEDILLPVPPLDDGSFSSQSESIRVLHVDDDPDFADMTATFLQTINSNLTVATETAAEAGLERLTNTEINCIVSDYQMPGKDGLKFLEAVRETYPNLPFILFTGKGSEEIASEAIATGVTDYMQKGGSTDRFKVLANRIQNAVEQYETQQQLWTTLSCYQCLVEQDLVGLYFIYNRTIQYVNGKCADIFGFNQGDLIGESVLTVVAEKDRKQVRDKIQKWEREKGGAFQYSFTGRRKNDTQIPVEIHGGCVEWNDIPVITGILIPDTRTNREH